MNAVPARWSAAEGDGALKMVNWYMDAEGIIIECDVVQPPSMVGRTVHVHVRGDEIEWLLKEVRDVAIARRSQPMAAI